MISKYVKDFLYFKRSYCAQRTVFYYEEQLDNFLSWLKFKKIYYVDDLTHSLLTAYLLYLRSLNVKNVSVNTYFRAVKVFCKWLHCSGYILEDITKSVKLPSNDSALIVPVTLTEASACDNYFLSKSETGLRDFCIFHLMLDCGFRRQEVINLKLKDLTWNNMVHINNSKFNKSRVVILPEFLQQSIYNYVCCDQRTYLFLDRHNKGRISEESIDDMFYKLKKSVGIKRLHPHLLRHTFGTSYCYQGGNMEMLRLLMGHQSTITTQIYVHLSVQAQLLGSDIYKLDEIFFRRSI